MTPAEAKICATIIKSLFKTSVDQAVRTEKVTMRVTQKLTDRPLRLKMIPRFLLWRYRVMLVAASDRKMAMKMTEIGRSKDLVGYPPRMAGILLSIWVVS